MMNGKLAAEYVTELTWNMADRRLSVTIF